MKHCDIIPNCPGNIKVGINTMNSRCIPSYIYKTVVLKPNFSCCKNVLCQRAISEENVKYIIKYDFDLLGDTIVVPKNCILEFDGGSLKHGTIVGQDTLFINVGDVDIWGEDLKREGTWREYNSNASDREYDPAKFSGMGKVYLKKNIIKVDGVDKNVLVQDAFYKDGENGQRVPNTNTIFVVMYDFDLNGENIIIPENSVLEFDGGNIENGFVYGNNTVLIGGNKTKGVLIGLFKNENGEFVDGTGCVLVPNLGFDFAANRIDDLDYEGQVGVYAQGIIHTGNNILVFCSKIGSEESRILRYDNFFNYYGYVNIALAQVTHGGIGYYKDGYAYVASHINNTIVKYSVSEIMNATTGSTVNGINIQLSAVSGMNIIFLSYDYNNDTVLVASGTELAILDEYYNLIIKKNFSIPDRAGAYLQDIIWDNGLVTFSFCDYEYLVYTPSVIYYDIYSEFLSDVVRLPNEYNHIESEASCNYIGHDGIRLICGNSGKKGCILIGKFSNTTEVDTLSKNIIDGYSTGTAVYLNNDIIIPSYPVENEIVVPNGKSEEPFKNITSAHFFNKKQTLVIYFKSITNPYYMPLNMDSRIEIIGESNKKPTIKGNCLIVEGFLRLLYVNYYGKLRTEYSTLDIYYSLIDGLSSPEAEDNDIILKINRFSTLILNGTTIQNGNTGVYFDVGSFFYSDSYTMNFINLKRALFIYSHITFKAPRLCFDNFDNVETCIDSETGSGTLEFYIDAVEQIPPIINILDKSYKGFGYLVYLDHDINDRPRGVCTFMHKDDVPDVKGTLVGSNGSTLPVTMTTLKRTTTIDRVLLVGDHTFDSDLKKELIWNGETWVTDDGFSALLPKSGTTSERPAADKFKTTDIGFEYFDTTLGLPIYVKAIDTDTSTVTWVKSDGTTV